MGTTEVHKSDVCHGGTKLGTMGVLSPLGRNQGHSMKQDGGRWKTREKQRLCTQHVVKQWSTLPQDAVDTRAFKKQPNS